MSDRLRAMVIHNPAALRAVRELWQGYATALFGGTPSRRCVRYGEAR
jgi:hypothetical protein